MRECHEAGTCSGNRYNVQLVVSSLLSHERLTATPCLQEKLFNAKQRSPCTRAAGMSGLLDSGPNKHIQAFMVRATARIVVSPIPHGPNVK